MSTVTLTPSSSISLPSNVSVTPFINGIAQTTRTCSITINPFTSPATISGANTICTLDTSTTYTINAGAGNTVNWSSSDLTKAIISTQSLFQKRNGLIHLEYSYQSNNFGKKTGVQFLDQNEVSKMMEF